MYCCYVWCTVDEVEVEHSRNRLCVHTDVLLEELFQELCTDKAIISILFVTIAKVHTECNYVSMCFIYTLRLDAESDVIYNMFIMMWVTGAVTTVWFTLILFRNLVFKRTYF